MTRERMNVELMRIQRETGKTVLLITLDTRSGVPRDRVLVMRAPGSIAAIYDVAMPAHVRSSHGGAGFHRTVQRIASTLHPKRAGLRQGMPPRIAVRDMSFF